MEVRPDVDKFVVMGELLPLDFGVLFNCNYTSDVDCSNRPSSGDKERGKTNLRFWPGTLSHPSHATQGIFALGMLVCLLVIVIIYCCWGTCWKYYRSRIARRQSQSLIGASCPRHEPSSSRPRTERRQRSNPRRDNAARKTSAAAPPSYDALFGAELQMAPPSYSSLELNVSEIDGDTRQTAPHSVAVDVEIAHVRDCASDPPLCQVASSLDGLGIQPIVIPVK